MKIIERYSDIVVNDELVLYVRSSGEMYPVEVAAAINGRIYLTCKNHADSAYVEGLHILDHSTGHQAVTDASYLVKHFRKNPRQPNVINITHPNRLWNWEDLELYAAAVVTYSEKDALATAITNIAIEDLQVLGIDRLRHVVILLDVNPFGDEERCTKETNNE